MHAAQQAGEAYEKDAEVERLGEVVVRAGGEAFDDVFGAAARGEQQHGDETAGLAQRAENGEAVLAGQHDVEQNRSGGLGRVLQPVEGGAAVGFVVGAVALGLEVEQEALGEVLFVFDDRDEG